MITIHELGHYLMGRLLGFKINEFAVGLGKPIFKWQSKKTGIIYSLRIIPLGGYCAFEGEDEAGAPGAEKVEKVPSYSHEKMEEVVSLLPAELQNKTYGDDSKPETVFPNAGGKPFNEMHPWRRLVVLFSGALFNFISAILFSIILLMAVGYYSGVRMGTFTDDSPNAYGIVTMVNGEQFTGGLQTTDTVTAIRGSDQTSGRQFTLMRSFGSVMNRYDEGDVVYFTVRRGSEVLEVPVLVSRLSTRVYNDEGTFMRTDEYIGIGIHTRSDSRNPAIIPARVQFFQMGFFEAIWRGLLFTFELAGLIFRFLGLLVTGQLGLSGVGGPLATIGVMSEGMATNFVNILLFVPLIAVNLALFNLLPIPALDGARMVFVGIEWVRGKPINPEIEGRIHMVGIILLMCFVLFADLNFFFGGGRGMLEIFGQWRL